MCPSQLAAFREHHQDSRDPPLELRHQNTAGKPDNPEKNFKKPTRRGVWSQLALFPTLGHARIESVMRRKAATEVVLTARTFEYCSAGGNVGQRGNIAVTLKGKSPCQRYCCC